MIHCVTVRAVLLPSLFLVTTTWRPILSFSLAVWQMMPTVTDTVGRIAGKLQNQDRTLWEKIKDFFTGLVEKLRNAYQDAAPDSEIAKILKRAIQDNEALAEAWASAVVDAGENYQLQDGQKKNAREGERYSLRGYTEQQKKNWESSKRIVIYDNQEQLSQFISDSIANKTMDKKMYFGAIPTDLATRIKTDTGIDVENFNLSLGSYEIRKILKDHGNTAKEAARGQRAIVADDFGYITDIVLNPTEIKLSNQDYMGKPAIIFSGDHNGRMNVVAVVSDKRLDLFVQTVYTNVKKGNLATPTGEQAPINTPEANSSTVSNNSIRKSSRNVNSLSDQTETENFKKWFGDWQNDPTRASKVVNEDGTPKVLYHQTAEDFTIFEPRHQGAGTRDSDTPFGIFMKSSDKNIGLNGEKQMALYAKIVNPLTVVDRADLIYQLKMISPEYVKAADELHELNDAYQKKYDDATKAFRDYIVEWRKAHPDASRTALYDDAGFTDVYNAEDNILDEWEAEARKVELRSKEAITRDLESHGYDGVIIQFDKGSWGRSTDAYIALHPEQVKSATDNIGTFDKTNPDIRFSQRVREGDQVERLAKQNEVLEKEVEYLKELVKIQKRGNRNNILVSIYAPARGETPSWGRKWRWRRYFNSRPCVRGDYPDRGRNPGHHYFNSRPCVRGDRRRDDVRHAAQNFNSRPCVRGDFRCRFGLAAEVAISILAPA